MLQRDPSVQAFWTQNRDLFEAAWRAWDDEDRGRRQRLDTTLYAPKMRQAIEQAWKSPSTEVEVAELWDEILPGVYEAQFFDADRLSALRSYLDEVDRAEIPLRPPYGIVLNRGGAMLDPRSEGYLAAPSFQSFYRDLMDRCMRPIARLLFPEVTGYETETFGFSVKWQAGKDTSLRPHTDASSVTLNINLNLPDEAFSGSEVGFFDPKTRRRVDYTFGPGRAVLHRGDVPHVSMPITEGERSNLVLWLYGQGGRVASFEVPDRTPDPVDRWSVPPAGSDLFAPF